MKRLISWLLCALIAPAAFAQHRAPGLGTTAAMTGEGTLWVAYVEGESQPTYVVVRSTRDLGKTWTEPRRVMTSAEPVSGDGENRPKLVVGPKSELYVTWTTPTSAKYTGDIRFVRSLDRGKTWSTPVTVHRDRQVITHRFESLLVDRTGRLWVTWIDKRDLHAAEQANEAYMGAAIYYAYSDDQGTTWQGDLKLAAHSCECCRIALTLDHKHRPTAMWRHVFANNERDHAIAQLTSEMQPTIRRVTFDRWRIDACPHHGPSLAFDGEGGAHAVWFNHIDGEGRAFYGQVGGDRPVRVRQLPAGAMHADLVVRDSKVAIAWKRFDGESTRVETLRSNDSGRTFAPDVTLSTQADSDQPRLVSDGQRDVVVWRTLDGIQVRALGLADAQKATKAKPVNHSGVTDIEAFGRDSLKGIERAHRGQPFWLVLWDLECTYCMKSLQNLGRAQKRDSSIRVVTIATDPVTASDELRGRLQQFEVVGEHYAFGSASSESLRHAIDPKWLGEKPRAYRYAADGKRRVVSGVIEQGAFSQP